MKNIKDLLSPSDYAASIGESHQLINYYIKQGRLSFTLIGKRKFIRKTAKVKASTKALGRPPKKKL